MRTIAERMLPSQFLLDLGVYLQTAAHIELAVWQITMYAEGCDLSSVEEFRGYVELKLGTKGLLQRFRHSGSGCPENIAARMLDISDQIARGLETRNLLAHGAFFVDDPSTGSLGAAHFFARRQGSARELFEVRQTVVQVDIEKAILQADQVLHAVIALRTDVIAWRYPASLPASNGGQTIL
jgi:hypothetical protein